MHTLTGSHRWTLVYILSPMFDILQLLSCKQYAAIISHFATYGLYHLQCGTLWYGYLYQEGHLNIYGFLWQFVCNHFNKISHRFCEFYPVVLVTLSTPLNDTIHLQQNNTVVKLVGQPYTCWCIHCSQTIYLTLIDVQTHKVFLLCIIHSPVCNPNLPVRHFV